MKVKGEYPIVQAFKGLNVIVNQAVFIFNQDGLTVTAVDPANVSMVQIRAEPQSFDVYTVDEEVKIGLDVDKIFNFLKIAKRKDVIEMEYDKEKNLFKLKVGNIEYQIAIISPEAIKVPKYPDLEFTVRATIDAGEFKKVIQYISKIKAEEAVFRSDETGLYIEANTEIDRLVFSAGELEMIEFNKGKGKGVYSIEYLKDLVKVAERGDTVTIQFGDDIPLSLTYNVGEKVYIKYLLAPRIQV